MEMKVLTVDLAGVCFPMKTIFVSDEPELSSMIWTLLEELTGLTQDTCYAVRNGRVIDNVDLLWDGHIIIIPRLLGGKGGFGSMLRAIGAQIEKTTNREACRDLSGRRLRDINEEKRLKAWIEKQSSREEEAAERKKKKLEKLCAVPRHEFKDQRYEQERAELTEKVEGAVEEGFKAAVMSGIKRKLENDVKPNKKCKTMLDLDIDLNELDTSDDSNSDSSLNKKREVDHQVSNDSGHSSDESGRVNKGTEKIENEHSEASSNSQPNDEVSSTESVNIKSTAE